ncbi:hypothetical protein MBM_04070 [Drepanopeziza brunnea f. sp. 'multigermtubi' MB_m1]|uniref:Retrotransposon gag domain-containing protein n=1 Tax=Marssonina brunnea f. sp. multigermtubi (strain MB_m1) TaxID=1072389 RepID=K1WXC4_MARBU|nr:uncharacterized protein MBM_04070 [Drepanopeziza brunnea f. sp. 'multigermtubi' MB_m1]EKD17701.1 hypothetical protein MBM_04070 [Drepanopeziza brunnea f. sp. 'multigermtubi' MB_m1]
MSSHEDDGPSPLTRIAQLESLVEQLRTAPRQRKCVLPDPDKFNGTDYNTLLDQLALAYDNPNKIQEAEDKLLACKQGTDALHIYVSRFERLLHAARCQTWPDANKIIAFRNGLNSTIRTRLNGQLTLPITYTEYVHVTQQLGRSSGSSGPSGPSHGFPRPSAPPQNRPRTSTGPSPGDPMDLSAVERAQQLEQLQHANELGAIELIDAHEADQTQLLEDRYPTLQHAPHSTLDQREAWRKSNRSKPLTKKRVLWDPFSDRPVRENEGLSEFDSDEREEILAEWNASRGYDADPDDYRDL